MFVCLATTALGTYTWERPERPKTVECIVHTRSVPKIRRSLPILHSYTFQSSSASRQACTHGQRIQHPVRFPSPASLIVRSRGRVPTHGRVTERALPTTALSFAPSRHRREPFADAPALAWPAGPRVWSATVCQSRNARAPSCT
jgi:hypothetical protein